MQLTQEQIKSILSEILSEKQGLSNLVRQVLEIIMQQEREFHNEINCDVSNGYRSRRLICNGNMLELRVPRSRWSHFMPIILGVLKNQEKEMQEVASYLYSRGSSMEDISGVFERLYGKHYSTSQINRLTLSTLSKVQEWQGRPLEEEYEALMIDATYIPVRRGNKVAKEAYFIVMSLDKEGCRDILGVYNNPTEGSHIWSEFFQDLKSRGLKQVGLIVSDGLNGIEEIAERYFHGVEVQLCAVHLQRSILNKVRATDKRAIGDELKEIFSCGTERKTIDFALENFREFAAKWKKNYPFLERIALGDRIKYYLTYFKYSPQVRGYIYTTNWIERFNRIVKKAAKYKGAFPSVDSPIHLIASIALNSSYLQKKLHNLVGGLKKIDEL